MKLYYIITEEQFNHWIATWCRQKHEMVSKIYRPRKLKKIAGIEKIPSMKKCGAVIGSAYLQRC